MPTFMVHDRWANVLFLHWRVPPDLEPVLQQDCGPFLLDRTPDGSTWIGLVLLTEQNVGVPYFFRNWFPTVTHHGANIRTYVKGMNVRGHHTAANDGSSSSFPKGIHFSSLECDDRFTSFGANWFGMPYRVARMSRCFEYDDDDTEGTTTTSDLLSVREQDGCACIYDKGERRYIRKYRFTSERMPNKSNSMLLSLLFHLVRSLLVFHRRLCPLHNTELRPMMKSSPPEQKHRTTRDVGSSSSSSSNNNNNSNNEETPARSSFSIECEWERPAAVQQQQRENVVPANDEDNPPSSAALSRFLVERYSVYTTAYGLHWRGQVTHAPWQLVEPVRLTKFSFHNGSHCYYEPQAMRPLLRYMDSCRPDSVLFSEGVGPIHFEMLRTVDC